MEWQSCKREELFASSWCRQFQKSVVRIDVMAPLAELGEDVVDFFAGLGTGIVCYSAASGGRFTAPFFELGTDLVTQVQLRSTRSESCLDEQRGVILSPRKSSLWPSFCKPSVLDSVGPDWANLEEGFALPFIFSGLVAHTPSGMIVMASISPAISLKTVCVLVGVSMLWKCWGVIARSDASLPEDSRRKRDLAVAAMSISGALNLGLGFCGYGALNLGSGISLWSQGPLGLLAGYVAHPVVFMHYLGDVVLNPLLLSGMAHRSTKSVMPCMVVSVIGAGCMVGASVATGPAFWSMCAGANACCILYQGWHLKTSCQSMVEIGNLPGVLRNWQMSSQGTAVNLYIFAQSLSTVSAVLAVGLSLKAAVIAIPLIDMLGKMGVVQLANSSSNHRLPPPKPARGRR